MKKKINRGNTEKASAFKLVIGVLTSIFVMLVTTTIFAILIQKQIIAETGGVYCTIGILYMSSIAGAFAMQKGKGERPLFHCLITGMLYLVVLLMITALFFDGRYENVFTTSIVVFSGCIIPVLLSKKGVKNSKLRRRKI